MLALVLALMDDSYVTVQNLADKSTMNQKMQMRVNSFLCEIKRSTIFHRRWLGALSCCKENN